MGLFSSKPSKAEVRKAGRGGKVSVKAAEAHAQAKRDQAVSRRYGSLADQSAAWKKKGK